MASGESTPKYKLRQLKLKMSTRLSEAESNFANRNDPIGYTLGLWPIYLFITVTGVRFYLHGKLRS